MSNEDKLRRALETATAQLKNVHGQIGGDELARDIKTCDEALAATQEQRGEPGWENVTVGLQKIRNLIYSEPLSVLRAMHSNPILEIDALLATLGAAPAAHTSSKSHAQTDNQP